jgi:hypothetical protein
LTQNAGGYRRDHFEFEGLMSTSSWVADALLGPPIPPPRWLDPRNRGNDWVAPPAGLWPFGGMSFHVAAGYIDAELDALASCVNPPVVQGWAWCLSLACAAAMLLGLSEIGHHGAGDGQAIAMILLPIPAWFVALLIGGFFSHDVELREGSVHVRRWTDVWLGRPGRLVGPRSSVHAVLSCGSHLHLAGDAGVVVVSMAMWPSSSRRALEERFEKWEIELEFPGRHHVHHPSHWNHGHHRFTHPLPEQGRHRHPREPAQGSGR